MEKADWHTYQVLTKRSSALRDYVNARYAGRPGPGHVWLGVSVEDRAALTRVDHLRQANAAIRFLSVEPLLESLGELNLEGIHWVIAGGESGAGYRAVNPDWIREVRDQCQKAGVPFFFKQWGGRSPKKQGRVLDGREWSQGPGKSFGIGDL
jgi:protein gp37